MNFMYWKLPRITNCTTLVGGFMHFEAGERAGQTWHTRLMYRHASYKSNAGKREISRHRFRSTPLQRKRRQTRLHNIVVINFLIARSLQFQKGRLHLCALVYSRKSARINLPFHRYREIQRARNGLIPRTWVSEVNFKRRLILS